MKIDSFKDSYFFLSNFYPAEVEFEGRKYKCAEGAYQAAKTTNLNARLPFEKLNGREAKAAGKRVILRRDWDTIKLGVMDKIVRSKFQHKDLQIKLLNTGSAELVEGNWWGDTFWGICNGRGSNHLGKILMKIRDELHTAPTPLPT